MKRETFGQCLVAIGNVCIFIAAKNLLLVLGVALTSVGVTCFWSKPS